MKIIAIILLNSIKIIKRLIIPLIKTQFKKCGKNVTFNPFDYFSYSNVEIGNDVFIGSGAYFSSIDIIKIGNKVMFGPNVTIIGGDHNSSVIGKYMYDVKEKLPENDKPVVINDDIWIGTGSIILKGVTIGEGSIVGAGSLVIKDVPSNTIVAGVPAKFIKNRFTDSQLSDHFEKLNS
jgi:acetyltransferase-like isoleucine patch superfamily enzyme